MVLVVGLIWILSSDMICQWNSELPISKNKMALPRHQIGRKDGFLNYYPPPLSLSSPLLPPPPSSSDTGISPAVLFVIVILAVLFFISGLLHLLVRFLNKRHPSSSSSSANGYPDISATDALQGQLHQLFHMHDSGLDQAFIDSLPVFLYKDVVGPKEPSDCAVCLSEFYEKDKLRLLPMCSHAFHMNCIDTWLLSNSTCPLCRATLFTPGFPMGNPIFEYDEYPLEEDGCSGIGENGLPPAHQKAAEIEVRGGPQKGVLPVRLGKFKKLDGGSEEPSAAEASNSNLDARRCYSMGSYQYVVGNTNLRVALCPNQRRRSKEVARYTQQHIGDSNSSVDVDSEGKKISSISRGDSYSVSKIWLWQKKGDLSSSSRDVQIDLPSLSTEFPWNDRTSSV